MNHKTNLIKVLGLTATLGVALLGCNSTENKTSNEMAKIDGEVTIPNNYKSWPKFVPTIDKTSGHVREIYINNTGLSANKGDAFPPGTITVMEIYGAKKTLEGKIVKNTNGKFIKDKLAKIFVMEKGEGWGQKQPAGTINNGDWSYGAYLADSKTPATSDFTACRGCHLPLADKDFVARYDQHFDYQK